MKFLDKTKEYYLGNLNKEQRGVLYDYLLSVDYTYETISKTYFEHICDDYISFEEEWFWTSNKQTHITTDALELFEPQFKKGDKVLVSDNGVVWEEREFIMQTIRGSFCFSKDYSTARWYAYIKPYEDEIKVGDWVKDDCNIIKITESNLHFYDNWNENAVKITNPQLIELLNNEL